MKSEREKLNAKVKAASLRLTGGRLDLPSEEDVCYLL